MRREVIGDATLILGDCREVLGELDELAQLCLTDPPYGNVVKDGWDRFGRDGFDQFLESMVTPIADAVADNGSLFWFCYPNNAASCEHELSKRMRVLSHVVWRKGDPFRPSSSWAHGSDTDALRTFFPETERIIFCEQYAADRGAMDAAGYDDQCAALHKKVYGSGPFAVAIKARRESAGLARWQVDEACAPSRKPTGLCYRWEEGACNPTFEQYAGFCRLVGDQRTDEALRQEYEALRQEYEALRQEYEALRQEYEALRRPFFAGKLKTDLWEYRPPLGGERSGHPCEKPVPMLVEMVRQTTRRGDLVIDPFMGVGGTGVACVNLGRRFIGIEIDEKYHSIACRRIEAAYAQPRLFEEPAPKPTQEALL